ncbi:recombinase family protein [Methylobacterium sp. BTF04]|uniref:recombinase family protein n=1 Tax=Methylobacterium sp. BTF04 TaxID=2708300 RepID=UPI0013D1D44C|nr:recombinase family protein [Methylobacterium sp. BTF04]NEU13685.1 recombinase family protein [Methylobacterium sp. BTF04]
MRVATYARASTNKQELSVPDQQGATRRYAAKSLNWRIMAEIGDVKSGRYASSRVGFQELKRRIKNNEFDIVLIDELTRLSRKFRHILMFNDLCKQHRVTIITINKGELNNILLMALAIAAELQLETGSEQVIRALKAKLYRGLRSSSVPYGYRAAIVNGEKGHLDVNKDQARQVVRIFKWAATGMSLVDICVILNSEKVPAPRSATWKARILSRVVRSTDGSSMLRSGILHNPVYYGKNLANRIHREADAETEAHRIEIRPESEWIKEAGLHKKIILEDLFDRVQAVRGAITIKQKRSAGGRKALLTGKIFCSVCNGTMIRSSMGEAGRQRIRCRSSIFKDQEFLCTNTKSHYADVVDHAVVLAVTTYLSHNQESFKDYLNAHNAARAAETSKNARRANSYKADVERISVQIDNLVNALANGGDYETLNPKISDLKKQKADFTALHRNELSAKFSFKIDKASIDSYRRALSSLADRLNRADGSEALDDGVSARFRALIERVVLYSSPKHKQGFRAEIFSRVGDLVAVDAGKNLQSNDTFQMESVVALQEWARANLVVELPPLSSDELSSLAIEENDKLDLEPARKALMEILAESSYPMLTSEIIPLLQNKGFDVSAKPGFTSLKYIVKNQIDFINLKGSGYWLRQRPYPLVKYDPSTPNSYDKPLQSLDQHRKKLHKESGAVQYIVDVLSFADKPLNFADISFMLSLSKTYEHFSHPIYGVRPLTIRNAKIFCSSTTNVYWLKNPSIKSRYSNVFEGRIINSPTILQSVCDEMLKPIDKYEILKLMEERGFKQSWCNVSVQLASHLSKNGMMFIKDQGWWPADRNLTKLISGPR